MDGGKFVKYFISNKNGENQLLILLEQEHCTKQGWEVSVSYNCILVFDLDGILHKYKRNLCISYITYSGLRGLLLTNSPTMYLKLKLSKSENMLFGKEKVQASK